MERKHIVLLAVGCLVVLLVVGAIGVVVICDTILQGVGAGGDFVYRLSDEYVLFRANAASDSIPYGFRNVQHTSSSEHRELRRGDSIPPHIVRMRIVGRLVAGYAVVTSAQDSVEGHFLLDLDTGEGMHGLDEEAWLQALKERGIGTPPVLLDPREACEEAGCAQLYP